MFPPVVADGIAYASAIALMACGITLIYMCTRTFNFAHASMATWGLFIVYTGVELYGGSPYHYFPLAFLFGGLLGAICYICVNGPLIRRQASEVTLMMSTLGYELVLLSALQMYADYLTLKFKLYPRLITMGTYDFQIFGVKAITVISFVSAVTILTALHLFLVRTKFGIAIRATVENPPLANIVGINSEKVYMTSWIIGGGLASLGGAVVGLVLTGSPYMGWTIIVTMFAASILGGLYSIYGGTLGGYIVGIAEYVGMSILAGIVGPWILPYRPVVPLIIMSIALLAFPQGLAGIPWSSLIEKVFKGVRKETSEGRGKVTKT